MSTTSSKNFTTLYSGSGSVVPQGAYGNANVVSLLAASTDGANTIGNISATGNVTASYFIGNGSQLTGIASSYGNSNVESLLASGTVTSNVITAGNISGGYILGNGSQLTGLPATYGNANVAAYLPTYTGNIGAGNVAVTSNVSAGNISTPGTITATGNITTAGYFVGNFSGNISGNITVPGSNTQVLFNSNGNAGASGDFTFNDSTNVLSVTGNINATNFAGSGAGLTNLTGANVTGTVANATHATVADSANAVAGANVTGTVGLAQYVTQAAQGNITSVGTLTGLTVNGAVSASGNITGGNLITTGIVYTPQVEAAGDLDLNVAGKVNVNGNLRVGDNNTDTQISTHGNANLTLKTDNANSSSVIVRWGTDANIDLVPHGTGQTNITGAVSASGNVTGSNIIGNGQYLTNLPAANVSGTVANAAYANTAGLASYVTANAQANITSVGTLTSLAATGNISTTGNVVGAFLYGDGSNITGLPATYGNTQVSNYLASGTNSANIVQAGGTAYFKVGTGNTYTGYANNLLFAYAPLGGPAQDFTMSAYGTGGIGNSAVYLDGATGNVEMWPGSYTNAWIFDVTGNLTMPGNSSAINYANGTSILSGLAAAGSNTQIQFNDAGAFAGNSTFTFNKVSGNVNVPVLISAGNVTSTQQTVVGTANVGTTGNIVISGRNIATDMAWNPDGGNALTNSQQRVLIGTGWAGNITNLGTASRFLVQDAYSRSNTASAVRQIEANKLVSLTANVANTSFREQGFATTLNIGGGASSNTLGLTSNFGSPFSYAGGQFNVNVGNVSPYALGNTTVGHATVHSGLIQLQGGSSIGNAYGMIVGVATPAGSTGTSNITNWTGFASTTTTANVTANAYMFYNGNSSTLGQNGIQTANSVRGASNYYFLRNDDDVAQNKLGSLRTYHEYQYTLATSGTVNIDKNNAQVQYLNPTGNVTIGDLQNFVTNANDGTNNDKQSDTVTLIIEQGATPYNITMPTGNASIKYAGNVTVIGNTANAVTLVSISAIRSAANTAMYLTTISPEFV